MYKLKYSTKILNDNSLMEKNTLIYFVNASAFLYNYLHEVGLGDSIHTLALGEWLNYFDKIGQKEINGANFKILLDFLFEKFSNFHSSDVIIDNLKNFAEGKIVEFKATKFQILSSMIIGRDLIDWQKNEIYKTGMGVLGFIYGPIGSFIYICEQKNDPQFLKELKRLFEPNESMIGQEHLFFMVYWLKSKGYKVGFVDEEKTKSKRTPDLFLEVDGDKIFIEATTKNSSDKNIFRQIQYAIDEKKQKFKDNKYQPGLIAIDLGSYDLEKVFNYINIRKDCTPLDIYGAIHFKIFNDLEFSKYKENQFISDIIETMKKNPTLGYLVLSQSSLLEFDKEGLSNPIFITIILKKEYKPILKAFNRYYWYA